MYSMSTNDFAKFLVRCTLPVRDVALSPDGEWIAVASDELTVKIVKITDTNTSKYLRSQSKPVKHLSYHPNGKYIALSCSDGCIYMYKLSGEEPELVSKIEGVIRSLETDSEISSRIAWHPDGKAFAAPTATRDIQIVSISDWKPRGTFSNGHMGDVTALAWSPNGALLATAGKDRNILLWETKSQTIVARYDQANVMDLAWHPKNQNLLSFTNTDGEVYIHYDFVPKEHAPLLDLPPQPSPFLSNSLSEISGNVQRPHVNGKVDIPHRLRRPSIDSLDDIFGPDDAMGVDDDFVEDDDGAGYTALGLNANGKRPSDIDSINGAAGYLGNKRMAVWRPDIHESFQAGATPWRGDRKYLCLNLIGFVWTVNQETHNTVTVEFYDQGFRRDFHFTDTFLYDKACLNENGTLFSCPPVNGNPASLFYRPHETWTERQDWRTQLPEGETITAMSLSESFITITTSANYVRVYTLFLTPYRVYRQKSSPTVTCASWRDYVLTMGNGPVGADGTTQLLYTIENIKRDETCQSEDVVALPKGATIKSVFFSENGVSLSRLFSNPIR
jgi:chromosome transmission fidelity protein 4